VKLSEDSAIQMMEHIDAIVKSMACDILKTTTGTVTLYLLFGTCLKKIVSYMKDTTGI
jgi:hypothetical protein